jgi:hypothetical protein
MCRAAAIKLSTVDHSVEVGHIRDRGARGSQQSGRSHCLPSPPSARVRRQQRGRVGDATARRPPANASAWIANTPFLEVFEPMASLFWTFPDPDYVLNLAPEVLGPVLLKMALGISWAQVAFARPTNSPCTPRGGVARRPPIPILGMYSQRRRCRLVKFSAQSVHYRF